MTVSAFDAHEYPIYNARFRAIFPILDADGDLVTGATTPDSEISQDSGTFADATNEMTEIATASGVYYLDLIATEMDTKSTTLIAKTATAGAKTTVLTLNPRRLPIVRTGTAQAGAASTITLDASASGLDDFYNGCWVNCTNDTPTNVRGQCRRIVDYVGSTKVATIEGTWGTNPSSSTTFEVLAAPEAPMPVVLPVFANELADAHLRRDMSQVTGEAARSPLNALRFVRNKWSLSGSTLTVTKEDDSTSAWTATVTTDAAAVPIIGNDPA